MCRFFARRASLALCLFTLGCGDPAELSDDASTYDAAVDADVTDATEPADAADAAEVMDATDDAHLPDAGPDTDASVSVCTLEDAHCRGLVPVHCQDGRFVPDTACPYACVDGTCTGECLPGARACGANETTMTCDASGHFVTGVACAHVCVAGECAGSCDPGGTECRDGDAYRCDASGAWSLDASCPYACTDGACTGECAPGARACAAEETTLTCDASGHFVTGVACEHVCTDGECAGSCDPGSTECREGDAYACDATGAWSLGASCPYVCTNGACTGVCTPGATRCRGAIPDRCDATGTWIASAACAYGCVEGACRWGCGDGVVDHTETCDPADTAPRTCASIGYGGNGSYVCTASCTATPTGCTPWSESFEGGVVPGWASGAKPWLISTAQPKGGVYALRSAQMPVDDLGSSSATLTVEFPTGGTISWWWRIESEDSYDFGYAFMDGQLYAYITGIQPWAQQTIAVGPGFHTFRFEFVTDAIVHVGADAIFLDDITTIGGRFVANP